MITKPKGTYDIKDKNARVLKYIDQVVNDFAEIYNYDFIRTPIFESSELFHRSVGETSDIVTKETYDFMDRGERNLTLRPEGTASVVRSYIENKVFGETKVAKYFYNGTMYRYERPQSGRNREFTQYGMEILGSNDPHIDAELISLPLRVLEALNIKDLIVNINTLGDKESRMNYTTALKEYFEPYLNTLCEDCQKRFVTNPLRILDCKVDCDKEVFKNAPRMSDYLNESSKNRFESVKDYLDIMGIDYEVDDNLVRGLDYYDHTVFEITCVCEELGTGNVLVAGGRYNGLVESLGGPSTPAIGFASGIERIMVALEAQDIKVVDEKAIDVFVLHVSEKETQKAVFLTQELRLNGFKTEMAMAGKTLKSQFKDADRSNCKYMIILNENDFKTQEIQVKDCLTKEITLVKEINIIDHLDMNF